MGQSSLSSSSGVCGQAGRQFLAAIEAEVQRQGLLFVVHAPVVEDALRAVELGSQRLTHPPTRGGVATVAWIHHPWEGEGVHDAKDTITVSGGVPAADGGTRPRRADARVARARVRAVGPDDSELGPPSGSRLGAARRRFDDGRTRRAAARECAADRSTARVGRDEGPCPRHGPARRGKASSCRCEFTKAGALSGRCVHDARAVRLALRRDDSATLRRCRDQHLLRRGTGNAHTILPCAAHSR